MMRIFVKTCIIVVEIEYGGIWCRKEMTAHFFSDLKGKLVQIQRGPATVIGSKLPLPLCRNTWEGVVSDDHKPGDLPNSRHHKLRG